MGAFTNHRLVTWAAWAVTTLIIALNTALIILTFTG